jgi:hypothetical protein
MMALPLARTKDLVVETLPDETLVYDAGRHRAHSLRPLAAGVWSLCDGERSLAQVAAAARARGLEADDALVEVALDGLARAGLVTGWTAAPRSPARRELLKRAAVIAGVATILTVRPPRADASD